MNALRQLFGGMTQVWLNVAFVVCMFGVVMFRPGRIRSHNLFRAAVVFFTLSLVVPGLGMFFLDSAADAKPSARSNPFAAAEVTMGMKVVNILPTVLYAIAFLSAIEAMIGGTSETTKSED
jgi:cytochrome c biogenesis factor